FLLALGASTFLALVNGPLQGTKPFPGGALWAGQAKPGAERTVFLVGDLSDESKIVVTSAVAACEHPGVVLFENPKHTAYVKAFLEAFRPERVIPLGAFAEGVTGVEQRLDVTAGPALATRHGRPLQLWKTLFARPEQVVVCPAEPRGRLLQ